MKFEGTYRMLEFKEIQLSDRTWINNLLNYSDFMGCEYSFANNLAWRRLNSSRISRYKDFYISSSTVDGQLYFTFPAGKGNYNDLFEQLKMYAAANGEPLRISSVNPKQLDLLSELYPNQFEFFPNEDSWDYIYLAEDLIELKGKKYHQKRNHISKFMQTNPNWSFKPLKESDFDDCITFSALSYNEKQGYDDASSISEQFAINTFFTYFSELELQGGILRIDGKLSAFTIGEKINSNTFCVHIEKALPEVQGAYPVINNEFAKYAMRDCKYINREEDLGIEGLRKSKRSYYPCFQIEKNTVIFHI